MDELTTVNVRMSDFERCNADLDRLEDENAKLRELVCDLERARFALCMYEVVDAQCDDCSASPVCATLYGRMEELKIEIPHD
jgi:hypothetical protein